MLSKNITCSPTSRTLLACVVSPNKNIRVIRAIRAKKNDNKESLTPQIISKACPQIPFAVKSVPKTKKGGDCNA